MNAAGFTKHYGSPEARATAERNHAWLTAHASPLRLPPILHTEPTLLTFEHVVGRHAEPDDLPSLAAHLGDAHGTAWARTLHTAVLASPHQTPDGHDLPDFPTSRLEALARRVRDGHAHPSEARRLRQRISQVTRLPAAFYKDSNPRNTLITPSGDPVTIDVDDLTLAPFGYDLAKLVVTLAMTHGTLPTGLITQAHSAYNHTASTHHPTLGVTRRDLAAYAELHGILTAPYLGRGGYRWPWHTVRS
ncbi:phosphotransferase [Streptomyces sp. 4N509B]|uniref:phosphotransferase n=1 Tax=Streptomyces sp. 4N509B TaxID=3457413 RepID=UPI003FCF5B38